MKKYRVISNGVSQKVQTRHGFRIPYLGWWWARNAFGEPNIYFSLNSALREVEKLERIDEFRKRKWLVVNEEIEYGFKRTKKVFKFVCGFLFLPAALSVLVGLLCGCVLLVEKLGITCDQLGQICAGLFAVVLCVTMGCFFVSER